MLKLITRSTALLFLYSVIGCSSIKTIEREICFDGWNTDISGISEVVVRHDEIVKKLVGTMPKNRKLICTHRMPSGRLLIINIGDRLYGTSFEYIDGKYIFDEEVLITG